MNRLFLILFACSLFLTGCTTTTEKKEENKNKFSFDRKEKAPSGRKEKGLLDDYMEEKKEEKRRFMDVNHRLEYSSPFPWRSGSGRRSEQLHEETMRERSGDPVWNF